MGGERGEMDFRDSNSDLKTCRKCKDIELI